MMIIRPINKDYQNNEFTFATIIYDTKIVLGTDLAWLTLSIHDLIRPT